MSTELRAMLERASSGPMGEVQIDQLWRSARRRSRVARFATTTALVAVLAVSSVVVSRIGLGESDLDRPSVGTLGMGSDGQIDQRVLNGVAPVSGDSMGSVRWLEKQMFRLKLPAVSECLQRKDREDLLPEVEADFEANLNAHYFDFPEPERLLEEGFVPSSESPFDVRGTGKDLVVADACTLDVRALGERAAHTQELHQSLTDDWTMILVNDVLTSDEELAAQERFGQCLRRHGVPAEFTVAGLGTVESAFFGWVGQTSPSGVEEAPLYIKCGRPLWATRERLLRERRETYLETHRDQLGELSDLLSDTGG